MIGKNDCWLLKVCHFYRFAETWKEYSSGESIDFYSSIVAHQGSVIVGFAINQFIEVCPHLGPHVILQLQVQPLHPQNLLGSILYW